MMILVGVTVTVAISGGLFDKTKEAKIKHEIALMQDIVETEYLNIESEKIASNQSNTTVKAIEVLNSLIPNTNFDKVKLEGERKFVGNSDGVPEGVCYIIDPDKIGIETKNGKQPLVADGIIKDAFVIVNNTSKIYYIKEAQIQENTGGGGGGSIGAIDKDDDPATIGAIEDLVDLAIAVNNGTTFEGQTVTLETSLAFGDVGSYRTENPDTEPYIDEEGNEIDANGDGIVDPIKVELTEGIGFQSIGMKDYQNDTFIPFRGSFDGQGNTISDLYINITQDEFANISTRINEKYGDKAEEVLEKIGTPLMNRAMYIGLFGAVESVANNTLEIKNLNMENTTFITDTAIALAPVAMTTGEGNFNFSKLNINTLNSQNSSEADENYCAGIVGTTMGTGNHTFTECNVDNFTMQGGIVVAGLMAGNQQKIDIEISKCNVKESSLATFGLATGLMGVSMNAFENGMVCDARIIECNVSNTNMSGMIAAGMTLAIGSESSSIENCHVSNSNLNGEEIVVGSTYMIMAKESKVIGCSVVDTNFESKGGIGGLLGVAVGKNVKIEGCSVENTNFKTEGGVGGLIGNTNGKNIEISNSFVKGGKIEVSEESSEDVIAGIVRYCEGDYYTEGENILNIAGCSFEDVDIETPTLVAGICGEVGYLHGVTIDKCYNTSKLPNGGAGILLHSSRANVLISNCYNRGRIETDFEEYQDGDVIASGIYGVKDNYSFAVEIQNCFNTGHVLGGIIHEEANNGIFVTNCYDRRYGVIGIEETVASEPHATVTACHNLTGEETPEQKVAVLSALNSQVESNNAEEDVIEWSTWVIDGDKNKGYPIFNWAAENWGSDDEDLEEPLQSEPIVPVIPEEPDEEFGAEEVADATVDVIVNEKSTINGEMYSSANPVIPTGFMPINTETAKWDAATGPEVNNGLVISDGTNEFVWVPVGNINEMVQCQTCSLYGILGKVSLQCPNCGTNTKIAGKLYDFNNSTYMEYLPTSNYEPETTYENNFRQMALSVSKYKGFYVGRYETSVDGDGKAQSRKSTSDNVVVSVNASSNGSWIGLYNLQRTYVTDSVQGELIWGSQYDAMVRWLGTTTIGSVYNTTRNPGAEPSDVIKNIYDLYGNSYEWTQESCGTSTKPTRGGCYNKSTGSIAYRCNVGGTYSGITATFEKNGSRMTLCITE